MRAAIFRGPRAVEVADAYAAMDERRALKSMIRVGSLRAVSVHIVRPLWTQKVRCRLARG